MTPLATLIMPAPDTLPLPAPALLLRALLLVTFLLHLVAMNTVVGGGLLALWLRRRGSTTTSVDARSATRIGKALPVCTAAAVSFGVAPLLFLQALYGRWFFTSSVLMAWPWFLVIPLLIIAYYGTYLESFGGERLSRWRAPAATLTITLFLVVALLYTINTTLMLHPELWPDLHFADGPGGIDPTMARLVPPRWLHTMTGAVAVAGLIVAWWSRVGSAGDPGSAARLRQLGLRALWKATTLNGVFGIWYLISLDPVIRSAFLGAQAGATTLLVVGALGGVAIAGLGWRASRREESRLGPVTVAAAVTLATMVLARDAMRDLYLRSHGDVTAPAVARQDLNVVLFAVLLAGGLVTIIWMVRRLVGVSARS